MKILLVNKFYYLKGGAERYFFDLKNLLEEKGNKVIPFSMQDERNFATPYEKYFVSKVDIEKPKFSFKAAGRILYSFEAKGKLEELIEKEKPDIAHLHNIYHQISPSILTVLKKHKIPTIMTLHDFKILCPIYILYSKGEVCEKCKTYRYWHCILRKCAKNSYLASKLNAFEMYWHKFLKIYENNVDLFVVPSEFLKNKILEWGRLPKEKIRVIPHFVDDNSLSAVIPNGVTNENLPGNYILYFGRLSAEKGVNVLLEAVKMLKKSGKIQTKFYLAGSGPQEQKLKEFVKKENLEDGVKFLGHLGKEELQKTIKNSLFTVMPSVVYESFGLATLESFRLGKPVLASNLGALPELVNPHTKNFGEGVKEGKTGMLFKADNPRDFAEKVLLMIQNQEKFKEMGEEAVKLVRDKYNKELHWQRLERIYKELSEVL